MRRTLVVVVLALAAGAAAWLRLPAPAAPGERMRGVSWVGERQSFDPAALDRVASLGANWIAQNPFGWQRDVDSTEIGLSTGHGGFWGESDEGLVATARLARERGIRTLLKPQIWLTRARTGAWLADVRMQSEEDWRAWFASYERFVLHYARLSEEAGIEALSVGAELRGTLGREADWRRLIAAVREVYRGQLTYAANWDDEFAEVPFWDALDWIGVQAYFPLATASDPALDALVAGWRPHLEALERVHRRTSKPIVFTEIGYRSDREAAVRPWEWEPRGGAPPSSEGLATQARCYEAFFAGPWTRPWLAGAFVWKWFPSVETARGGSFSPQGKPAEEVLARAYRAQTVSSPAR